MIRVYRKRVSRILGKSWIADYCINPYIGCSHGCLYCYARYYTRRFYKGRENWGEYVVIKENAPEVLEKEVKKNVPGTVYLSSLTDPYQPIERSEKLSRRILEILGINGWPAVIQTKSDLVLRDLPRISKWNFTLGLTIISLEEGTSRTFEPKAPPPSRRIEVLKRAKELGIKTYAFLGPILPGTEFNEVKELIESVREFSDVIYVDKFSYKPGLEESLKEVLGEEWKAWRKSSEGKDEYYKKLKEFLKKFDVKVLYREDQGMPSSSSNEEQDVEDRVA